MSLKIKYNLLLKFEKEYSCKDTLFFCKNYFALIHNTFFYHIIIMILFGNKNLISAQIYTLLIPNSNKKRGLL